MSKSARLRSKPFAIFFFFFPFSHKVMIWKGRICLFSTLLHVIPPAISKSDGLHKKRACAVPHQVLGVLRTWRQRWWQQQPGFSVKWDEFRIPLVNSQWFCCTVLCCTRFAYKERERERDYSAGRAYTTTSSSSSYSATKSITIPRINKQPEPLSSYSSYSSF